MKTKKSFSNWAKWEGKNSLKNKYYPGVYAIAYSALDLSGKKFSWIKKIVYIGMTNSQNGLNSRLDQFYNGVRGKGGHGGADRFRYKFPDYKKLMKKLYFAICPFICDVTSNSIKDLRIMGKVTEFEYVSFAEYVKRFGELPEFNNKKKSPKK